MKFLCLICAEKTMEQMPEADAEKHFQEYTEFTQAIRRSGHYVGCNRLVPPKAATTVRVRHGKISTTDGPYAETKEQLGGYYVIEARDLNEAIHRARAYLVGAQNEDGSWPETTRPPNGESYAQRISTTAWSLLALLDSD